MDRLACCPAKHEISDGQEDDTEQSGNETVLWRAHAVLHDVGDQVFKLVDQETGYADDAADTNGEEG